MINTKYSEIDRSGFGVAVTLCGNEETLCDGHDVGPWQDEVTTDAIGTAARVLWAAGIDTECSPYFKDWHGKHWSFNHGGIAGYWGRWEDGDPGRWVGCLAEEVPAEVVARFEQILSTAWKAISDTIAAWEAQNAKISQAVAGEDEG